MLYAVLEYLRHHQDASAGLVHGFFSAPWLYIGIFLLIPLFATIGVLWEKTDRERRRFETLLELAQDGIYVCDPDGYIQYANTKFLEIHGVRREDIIGKRLMDLVALPHAEHTRISEMIQQAVLHGELPSPLEVPFRRPDGSPGWLHINLAFIIQEGSRVTELGGISRDITERKRTELLIASHNKILDLIAKGAPLSSVLEMLCCSIEEVAPGVLCSILLLEGDRLRHGAAPSLPEDYKRLVDGLTIGPTSGSCGTAAYLKKPVIVSDTLTDPLWANYRASAQRYGLRACWSTPIVSRQGNVLGTFAMYYREVRSPSAYELDLIEKAAHLAALVLERQHILEAMHRREQILHAVAQAAGRLLSAPSWKACANEILQDLGQATRVSRVYIFENHRDAKGALLTSQRFEWVAPGITPQMDNPELQDFAWEQRGFHRWMELMERGEPVVGLVRDFPPNEQAVFTAQQIKSMVCVPIFVKGQWWGFIGFDECVSERLWSEAEIDTLKTAAHILGLAIEHEWSQELLRASEERYRSLFERVPIGLYRSTPDGCILDANNALVRMFGYPSKEALLAVPAHAFFLDPNERQRWQGEMDAKSVVTDFVTQQKRYDGTSIWVVDNSCAIRDSQGKVLYYEGSLIDITERVRAQEALQTSEARYRALVESSPDGIAIHQDGKGVFVNPAGARILGAHRPEELLGRSVLDFVHPAYHDIMRQRIQRVLEEWQPAPPLEEQFIRLDGTVIDVEVTSVPIIYEGRPAVQVIFRDISERKRMEEELRASEERYRDLFENANDGIYILDKRGRFLAFNRKAEEISGYTLEEVRGQPYTLLVPPGPERHKARRAFLKNMRGEPDKNELTIRRKDGREVIIELSTRPIWQNGQIVGIQGIGRDITERKEVEKLKSEFISTVSHELRTPLTSIKGYVDLVLAGDVGSLTPEQREFLTIVSQNTTRLTELINDLLEIERLESGRIEFEFVELDLAEVLQNVARSLQVNAEQKGLEFVTEIASGLKVRGDRERLAQVFLNLVSNAIKYTPAGTVELTAYREGDTVVVAVRDTGIGLSERDKQKLFQKFFRSDNPYVRKISGTGLGLSIAKAIVERHNSTITVTSELGQGSTFTVRLPALTRSQRPLVLVIEDELPIARLIATYIEKMGYRAIRAHSAREGFEQAIRLQPNLIILDVLMPDLDGFALIQHLKKHPATAHIPVIFLSIVQDKHQGLRLGASAFLTKPIDERKFYETVRALLEP